MYVVPFVVVGSAALLGRLHDLRVIARHIYGIREIAAGTASVMAGVGGVGAPARAALLKSFAAADNGVIGDGRDGARGLGSEAFYKAVQRAGRRGRLILFSLHPPLRSFFTSCGVVEFTALTRFLVVFWIIGGAFRIRPRGLALLRVGVLATLIGVIVKGRIIGRTMRIYFGRIHTIRKTRPLTALSGFLLEKRVVSGANILAYIPSPRRVGEP